MNLRLLGEGTVREFGMGVYTVMYLKQIIPRTYCVAQGTLLNVRCQPGWEGSLGAGVCWVSNVSLGEFILPC